MNKDIISILQTIPGFEAYRLDTLQFVPLGGLTNSNYKLVIQEQQFVLRIPGTGTDKYIDRKVEQHNSMLAAQLGLHPEPVYFNSRSGVQLSRYIDGATALNQQSLRESATLLQVVKQLKRLHQCQQSFLGRRELLPQLDAYLGLIAKTNEYYNKIIKLRNKLTMLYNNLSVHRFCPCHIDPVPSNFLLSDRLYLIDWEYSAMSEAVWDLANLSLEADFTAAQDQQLLDWYYDGYSERHWLRFNMYKAGLCIIAITWAILQIRKNQHCSFRTLLEQRLSLAEVLLR